MNPRVDMIEGSPPYLHTRYLSTEQQELCLENPTYFALLAELRTLREEIQESRIEFEVGLRTHRFNKRHRDIRKYSWQAAEEHFKLADDALSMLAEALVIGPVFRLSDEVEMVGGKWMWALPRPEPRMQRDMSHVQMDNALPRHGDNTGFGRTAGPAPARGLSRRVGRGLSRMFSRRVKQPGQNGAPAVV